MSNGYESSSGITAISVSGFKSLYDESRIEIRPLTILAGANSSGKSSIMQPLLLMKQTLEASYDPGPLLLNGPNTAFTAVDQFLSRLPRGKTAEALKVRLEIGPRASLSEVFERAPQGGLDLVEMIADDGLKSMSLRPSMTEEEILSVVGPRAQASHESWRLERFRCFLTCRYLVGGVGGIDFVYNNNTRGFELAIRGAIHVSGARANSGRDYRLAATDQGFQGRFHDYFASVLSTWRADGDARLAELGHDSAKLGFGSSVQANRLNDAQVEVLVNRTPAATKNRRQDMINISDVGSGVYQVLPVLVALRVAEPGQLVYLEQPEIHLHPRAQTALAEVLAGAARRGVRVVAETHSSLLLLAIQALVAEGKLSPDLVKLHWFSRDKRGATRIASAELDEAGRYGDWPEDFAEVELDTDRRYLDAADEVLWRRSTSGNGL